MWFYVAIALACLSFSLAVALCIVLNRKSTVSIEPRLLGTCVSDVEKTAEVAAESSQSGAQHFKKTKSILGKMRISYTPTEVIVALDGQVDTGPYRVLASDAHSCVISLAEGKTEIDRETDDILQTSSYTVIHFEDENSYWVQSQFADFVEYFRRLETYEQP